MKPHALEAYKILEKVHGEEGARVLISYYEDADIPLVEKEVAIRTNGLATKGQLSEVKEQIFEQMGEIRVQVSVMKEQIAEVKEDVANLRKEVKEDVANLRKEVKEDIANLRKEVSEDVANLKKEVMALSVKITAEKGDIIKWMFIFWVGQLAVMIGFLLIFLRR